MPTVPQNKDKFTINKLFYCCEALIFTHPLVYEFLCGLIFMAHPVDDRTRQVRMKNDSLLDAMKKMPLQKMLNLKLFLASLYYK